jgi:hypothetical protein
MLVGVMHHMRVALFDGVISDFLTKEVVPDTRMNYLDILFL